MSRWTIALLAAFALIAFAELRLRRSESRQNVEAARAPSPLASATADYPAISASLVLRSTDADPSPERTVLVARAGGRVHRKDGQSREWLFRREDGGSAKLSAALVDHDRRTVAELQQSDLARNGLCDSFEAIACLDVAPAELEELEPDGSVRTDLGLTFEHYAARPGQETAHGLREVWWNSEHRIPLQLRRIVAGRTIDQILAQLAFSVDPELMREPRERFPTYGRNPTSATSAAKPGDR